MIKKGLSNQNFDTNAVQETMSDRFGISSENLKQIVLCNVCTCMSKSCFLGFFLINF